MRLTVLGCSGTFPGPDAPCSSYLIEADGFRLMIDMGNGSSGVLQRCCGLLDVDAVLLSHLHGDHWLDLVTYTYARRYHPSGRPSALPVYGPAGTMEQVSGAFGRPVGELLAQTYAFTDVGAGQMRIGPFDVRLAGVNHPVETYGVRVGRGDRSVTYSADTGECDALANLARDTDLFLCEASYLDGGDNPPGIHLTGGQAGEHAARAGARRLLLTHLVPWHDPVRTLQAAHDTYDGDIELASSGQRIDV
jgi:ribonuclease BN (tRNA processing enzyme)